MLPSLQGFHSVGTGIDPRLRRGGAQRLLRCDKTHSFHASVRLESTENLAPRIAPEAPAYVAQAGFSLETACGLRILMRLYE